ncbi:MAG: Ig-like domain-containing protein [Candidatus Limivicinus sp.]
MRRFLSVLLCGLMLIALLPAANAMNVSEKNRTEALNLPQCTELKIYSGGRLRNSRHIELDVMSANPVIELSAECLPKRSGRELSWRSSSPNLVSVDENGRVKALTDDEGTVCITVSPKDGSDIREKVYIDLVKGIHKISLSDYSDYVLRSDTIVTLSPKFSNEAGKIYTPTEPELIWEVVDGGKYVSFTGSSKGTLRAENVKEMHTARIRVSAKNDRTIWAEAAINVCPSVTKVEFCRGDEALGQNFITAQASMPLSLCARCLPEHSCQDVKWASSNTQVATVEDGLVRPLGPGAVTITAAALDGSGKSAGIVIVFE